MLHGKILPQHRRARPHQVDRHQRGARSCRACYRVVTIDDVMKVIPDPYYGPAFHDQPILAHEQGALRRRAGRRRARHRPACRRGSGAADRGRIRGAAGGLRRGRGADLEGLSCTTSSSRPAPSPTSSISRTPRTPTSRSTSSCGAATSTRPSPRPRTCSSTPSAPRRCCICRSSRSPPSPTTSDTGVTIHTASQGPSFVRTEIARLLGWPENRVRVKVPYLGGGFGAKLYIKLEALVAALSMIARRPVKIALTMEEQFYTLTKHATHVPHQERRRQGRQHHRARMRGVVERRRLCRHRPARHAEIRLHRGRPLRHRQRLDRFLRALHQRDAGRRAARLRHSAAGVGLREPHRHDRARAQARSGRVPPQEPPARRPPAGDRHRHEGRRDRDRCSTACCDAHELVAAVRPRHRRRPARPRLRASASRPSISPTTSVAIVNVAADGCVTLYCGTVDMGQGSDTAMAQIVGEVLNVPAETVRVVHPRHRRDALRHGHARLALAVPHGPRGAARRRGRARQARGAGARGRRAGGHQHPDRRAVQEEIRHAGRQRHRHRHLQAGLHAARSRHRPVAERHAVLDGRRRRRRGRGRHRDRPRARSPS